MNLIIVESPTKSKTLKKFLGNDYEIMASMGHIRDLPKTSLGVDVEHDFEPKYVLMPRKPIKELKSACEKADALILATDEDREGEAIAWHLLNILKKKNYQRIVFHEITKHAIEQALKNPREIDMKLVNSQQARRILDRLVGYKLSPFLWKKVAKGLSAGRVQSVAVRLIVDREREIEKFKPEEYWKILAELQKDKDKFSAELIKEKIKNKNQSDKIIKELEGAEYQVTDVNQKQTQRNPYAPFTTSTIQQEASRHLHYSAKQTMMLAQRLYERGLITYHRTDSFNLAQEALEAIHKFIEDKFSKKYVQPRLYKTKSKSAQEAHEAIRPTNVRKKIDDKLYNLIWQRTIASQMSSAILDSTSIDIKAKEYLFRANGQIIKFDGFLKVYTIKISENILPKINKNYILELIKLIPSQHFTQPPARFSEATLIKELEKNGIGRPSTYAPILSTIQARGYVEKIKGKMHPQEIGILVNDILVEHFPEVVDTEFTAQMENDLDKIAQGEIELIPVIKEFYEPFKKNLDTKYNKVKGVKKIMEKTNEKCDKCGKPMVIRMGRFGKFLACTGFPECKNAKPIIKSTGIKCPQCNKGELIEKRTRKGKIFWGCSRYPECENATWENPKKDKEENSD